MLGIEMNVMVVTTITLTVAILLLIHAARPP